MLDIKISGSKRLERGLLNSPKMMFKYLGLALMASVFEVEKQANDKNFKFKTPRSKRSGLLGKSFSLGKKYNISKLTASIGPTVNYAPYVYYGTSRGIRPNKYLDRIVKASERNVQKHFDDAVARVLKEI